MIVTWRRYLARRGLYLSDLIRSYGFDYDGLAAYFSARGAVPPKRDEPEIIGLFGKPAPEQPASPASDPGTPIITSESQPRAPGLRRVYNVSIKNSKKQLLGIAEKLKMPGVSDKMSKSEILAKLESSDKVLVIDIKTIKNSQED